jgi:hypothetical protein
MDSGVSTLWSYINQKYKVEEGSGSHFESDTEETEEFGVPFLIK